MLLLCGRSFREKRMVPELRSRVSLSKAEYLSTTLYCTGMFEMGIWQNSILLNLNTSPNISLSEILHMKAASSPPAVQVGNLYNSSGGEGPLQGGANASYQLDSEKVCNHCYKITCRCLRTLPISFNQNLSLEILWKTPTTQKNIQLPPLL